MLLHNSYMYLTTIHADLVVYMKSVHLFNAGHCEASLCEKYNKCSYLSDDPHTVLCSHFTSLICHKNYKRGSVYCFQFCMEKTWTDLCTKLESNSQASIWYQIQMWLTEGKSRFSVWRMTRIFTFVEMLKDKSS